MKNTQWYLFAGLLLAACSSPQVEDTGKGIVVNLRPDSPSEAKKVRLEVLGEKLIRVSATPEDRFADPQSLIIVPQTAKVSYTVKDSEGEVSISTSEISASVSKSTGEVTFFDKDGNVIKQVTSTDPGEVEEGEETTDPDGTGGGEEEGGSPL